MRLCATVLLFASWVSPVSAQMQKGEVVGAWIEQGVKWQKGVIEGSPDIRLANVEILYFLADRSFLLWSGTMMERNKEMRISTEDPEALYLGAWEYYPAAIVVGYKVVLRTPKRANEALPGPNRQESLKQEGKSINFEDRHFKRAPDLDQMIQTKLDQAKKAFDKETE